MPQFELVYYLSQAFWMLISFGILYLVVAYFIFPSLNEIFVNREKQIEKDLSAAEKINERADALMKEYKSIMFAAEQTKAEMINATYQDIQKLSAHIEAENNAVLRDRILETEQKIKDEKVKIKKQSQALADRVAEQLTDRICSLSGCKK